MENKSFRSEEVSEEDVLDFVRIVQAFNIKFGGPPRGWELTATAALEKSVILKWNDNTGIGLKEYRVYRGLSDPPTTCIAEVRRPGFIDTEGELGVTYYYAIAAVDVIDDEEYAKSPAVSVTLGKAQHP